MHASVNMSMGNNLIGIARVPRSVGVRINTLHFKRPGKNMPLLIPHQSHSGGDW